MVERMRWLRAELWNLATGFFTGAPLDNGAVPLENGAAPLDDGAVPLDDGAVPLDVILLSQVRRDGFTP